MSSWSLRQYWDRARPFAEAIVLQSVTAKGLKSSARMATLLGPFCCQYHFGNVSQGETRRLDGAIFKAAEI